MLSRGVVGLRARAFDGLEQARSRAIGRRERNGSFRNRRRIVGDHRRPAAERKRTVVEDDLGLTNLDAAPARQCYRLFEYRAVVKRAVSRSQILEKVLVAFAAPFGMHTRRKRIRNAQIVARRAANRDAQAVDRKMLGGAI